jgi:hypothetical protein
MLRVHDHSNPESQLASALRDSIDDCLARGDTPATILGLVRLVTATWPGWDERVSAVEEYLRVAIHRVKVVRRER